MAKTNEPAPRYLQTEKDGNVEVRLYDGKDVEAAMVHGAVEPTRRKSNGEPYNLTDQEADIVSPAENQAAMLKLAAERNAKIAERKAKEAEEGRKQAEKSKAESAADAPARTPDFHVAIVSAPDDAKPAKK